MSQSKYSKYKIMSIPAEQKGIDFLALHQNFLGVNPSYKGIVHYMAEGDDLQYLSITQPIDYVVDKHKQNMGYDFTDENGGIYDVKCNSKKYLANCCFEMYMDESGYIDFGYNKANFFIQYFEGDEWIQCFDADRIIHYVNFRESLPKRCQPRLVEWDNFIWSREKKQWLQKILILFDREELENYYIGEALIRVTGHNR